MLRERDHRGDIMDAATRSRVMSRIRGRDTGPERTMAKLLADARLRVEAQARDLPGRPDFVLRRYRIAIFVDGAFWHGWRFSTWRHKLSERWETKIEQNRNRDGRNHRALRRKGWKVIRLWEFQLEREPELCLERVLKSVQAARLDLAEARRRDYE
jgi:DNA mismatch endonuclease (patch repair protein)